MACNPWVVQSGETSVAAATTKTLLQVKANASNIREQQTACRVTIRGGDAGDAPVLVELLRQTTAGTASTATPAKRNPDASETLQLTAQQTFTAEPTAGVVLDYRYSGAVQGEVRFDLPREIPSGGYLGVRVTTQSGVATVTGKAIMEGEE